MPATIAQRRAAVATVSSPAEFEKIRILGRGDVGRVYLTRHKASGELFALKVMSKTEMIARNKVL